MSRSIALHSKHCLAPAMMICPCCGKHTNSLALLGASADRVMRQVSGKDYQECGHNDIPDTEPCDSCKAILDNGGAIILGMDIGQSLLLTREMVDGLLYKVADAKGRILDFDALRGKIFKMKKAFWFVDGDNIRLRDPKEWTE
jgi:hypothetical protein